MSGTRSGESSPRSFARPAAVGPRPRTWAHSPWMLGTLSCSVLSRSRSWARFSERRPSISFFFASSAGVSLLRSVSSALNASNSLDGAASVHRVAPHTCGRAGGCSGADTALPSTLAHSRRVAEASSTPLRRAAAAVQPHPPARRAPCTIAVLHFLRAPMPAWTPSTLPS